jgi:hypothetical protein
MNALPAGFHAHVEPPPPDMVPPPPPPEMPAQPGDLPTEVPQPEPAPPAGRESLAAPMGAAARTSDVRPSWIEP